VLLGKVVCGLRRSWACPPVARAGARATRSRCRRG